MRSLATRRSVLGLLPTAALVGCAMPATTRDGSAPARFAEALAEIDTGTGLLLGRIGEQDGDGELELAAIGYATGRRTQRNAPLPSAAAAHAMEPVLVALALHGRRLAAMGAPPMPETHIVPPETPTLVQEAERGFVALRAAGGRGLDDAVRRRGLNAVRGLAASPPAGTTPGAYLVETQPLVADAAAYLLAVLGTGPGLGLRGALEARARDQLRAEEALLAAARTDRALSVLERYALFHRVAGNQSPLAGQLDLVGIMASAFQLMPDAHAALTQPDAGEAPDFAAFITAADAVHLAAQPAPPG